MKFNIKRLVALLLVICSFALVLTACGEGSSSGGASSKKLTEETIKSELADSEGELDGTLTIEDGSPENVKAFTYVVKGINASDLLNKTYAKKATNVLLTNPNNLTYAQLKVCNGISAMMGVVGIFYEDENFNAEDYIDEILSIICDGNSKTYGDWTVSANVNKSSDSLTIEAVHD